MISTKQFIKYVKLAGILIISLLAIIGISSIGNCTKKGGQDAEIVIQEDTIYIYDTIRIEKPVLKLSRITDTFLVRTVDTIRLKDTLYLALPREQKMYKEEDYQAWISGYRPELDSIHIFRNTHQIITSTTIQPKPKPRRWGVGIQAGYGLILQENKLKPSKYIGIGVSYNLLIF